MLQPLVGLVLVIIGGVFLYQSVLMSRVSTTGTGRLEPATVAASEFVDDGHPTDPARHHYSVTTRLRLADGTEVTHWRGFTIRPEAERYRDTLVPGARISVRRTGIVSPAILLEGEKLEPRMTGGMGGLMLTVGAIFLWLAWRDWRMILAS